MATQQEVDTACEEIRARGERPTVDRVTSFLGGGSPNRLTPMVRAWKEAQRPGVDIPAPAVAEPGALPQGLQRAIDGIQSALAALPPALVGAIAETAESERRRSRLEVDSARTGAQAQVDEARAAAEDERSATDSVRKEVSEREAELAGLAGEARESQVRITALEQQLAKAGLALDKGRGDLEGMEGRVKALTDQVAVLGKAAQDARAETAAANASTKAALEDAERVRAQLAEASSRMEAAAAAALADKAEAAAVLSALRTDLALARADAEAERRRAEREEGGVAQLRQERTKLEAAARDAHGRAERAEAEAEAVRAELMREEANAARLRQERTEGEVFARDAHGRAERAEAQAAAAHAELKLLRASHQEIPPVEVRGGRRIA